MAGDLIEHLTSFEGFFDNVNRLLKDDGILILTTPNPFFRDEFFYTVFKNEVIVNPEHTCWIDPACLEHLAARFSLEIMEWYWLSTSWKLRHLITQNARNRYDILKGRWEKDSPALMVKRLIIGYLFEIVYSPIKALVSRHGVNHSDYLAVIRKGPVSRGPEKAL